MVVYSIKDIEKLSGVKAHTIRIWEKRYGIIQPKRTPTNIRYYDENDLKQIMNIAFLNTHGYKISHISEMNVEERKTVASKISQVAAEFDDQIDVMTNAILQLDEANISLILQQNIDQVGLEETMKSLIYPLLDKMGVMWVTGSILEVHERFVSNILRNKIIAEIDKLSEKVRDLNRLKFLLFLPPGQSHELSLLYLHYLLKKKKCEVLMMGLNFTLESVADTLRLSNANYVFTILNDEMQDNAVQDYLNLLSQILGDKRKAIITGYQVIMKDITLGDNISIVQSMEDVIQSECFIGEDTTVER